MPFQEQRPIHRTDPTATKENRSLPVPAKSLKRPAGGGLPNMCGGALRACSFRLLRPVTTKGNSGSEDQVVSMDELHVLYVQSQTRFSDKSTLLALTYICIVSFPSFKKEVTCTLNTCPQAVITGQ